MAARTGRLHSPCLAARSQTAAVEWRRWHRERLAAGDAAALRLRAALAALVAADEPLSAFICCVAVVALHLSPAASVLVIAIAGAGTAVAAYLVAALACGAGGGRHGASIPPLIIAASALSALGAARCNQRLCCDAWRRSGVWRPGSNYYCAARSVVCMARRCAVARRCVLKA